MKTYHYLPGTRPIILSIPHAGTFVPDNIMKRFNSAAKQLPDTDWHIERLYAFAKELGINILIATYSRYVIDLNRAPNNESLYPGKFTTSLCPTTLFDNSPIYQKGLEPTQEEIQERIDLFWKPYHQKLQSIIDQLKADKPVILLDAHSICSQVPTLFEGVLPDLNLGTADGASAHPILTDQLVQYCQSSPYSMVCNGRFKGGYITRHYGNPSQRMNAIQLELSQINYMQETYPFIYDEQKAVKLQQTLQGILSIMMKWQE